MNTSPIKNRVVITGLGVVAPNGVGLKNFREAIKKGTSGIAFHQQLKDLNFSCCIGGIPSISEEKKRNYLTELQLRGFNSSGILYGCIAGIDAWKDAGFFVDENSRSRWSQRCFFEVESTIDYIVGRYLRVDMGLSTHVDG